MDIRTITLVVLYAFAFAIPEEILFRGFIQGILLESVENDLALITISTLVFGLAHLPNGARGWRPNEWNWNLCGLTLLVGLPLGYLFLATGSLLHPTLFHVLLLVWYKLFMDRPKMTETSLLV